MTLRARAPVFTSTIARGAQRLVTAARVGRCPVAGVGGAGVTVGVVDTGQCGVQCVVFTSGINRVVSERCG